MGNAEEQFPELTYCNLYSLGNEAILVVQTYLLPAFFLAVLVLGLPLNLLSLWVFSCQLKRWTRGTMFLFNLALADTSWLLALPFLIQYYLDQVNWSLGWPLCMTVRLLYHCYFYLSIFFVTCLSMDRYLAIVHPLRSLVLLSRRQASLLCMGIWAFTLAFSSPVAQMTMTKHCPTANHTLCTLYVLLDDPRESLPFSICWTCVGFLLPLAAIGYCCMRSVQELRRRHGLRKSRGRHLTWVLSAVLVLFALLYLPYHLTRNAAIAMRAAYPEGVAQWRPADITFMLEMCVCSLNSCINPLFSCFVGRHFRQEFWAIFARLWHCSSKPQPTTLLQERGPGVEDHTTAAVWAETTICMTQNWFPPDRENAGSGDAKLWRGKNKPNRLISVLTHSQSQQ